jgi:hypothetical protein
MSNLKQAGILPEYEDMPLSAIIGYVDVVGFDSDNSNDSPWAGLDCTHWQLANAYLFDEPITGVKGKLGLFDYPIDEKNMPPAHKVEQDFPFIEGDCLNVYVNDRCWQELQDDDSIFSIDINDPYVVDVLCKEDSLELKPVKKIRIIRRTANKTQTDVITRKVTNVVWDAYKDEEGKDLTYKLGGFHNSHILGL